MGEHDTSTTSETDHLRLNVEDIRNHPRYIRVCSRQAPDFDFSMVKLASAVDFSAHPHIRPICLPTDSRNSFAGVKATITGWGRVVSGGQQPSVLQEVDLIALSNSQCRYLSLIFGHYYSHYKLSYLTVKDTAPLLLIA